MEKQKMKRIWDNYKVIGEVQKSDAIKFVIAAAIRDGVKYINIREFYNKKSTGEWKPGRDGITIPVIVPINKGATLIKPIEGISGLLSQALEELSTLPIADEANAVYMVEKVKVK